ncbi:MAG: ABC transporter permease, partial [Bryobacteraceae bacterium]
MREWWNKLRGRPNFEADLAEELETHLAMERDELRERGLPTQDADSAARRAFGNTTRIAEQTREAWGLPSLESLFHDIRYGIRTMFRSPGFSAVVVLTLALGIGVNTAIFSVVNAVLLKPLPYPNGERLVWLGESTGKAEGISVTWGNFRHWREDNRTFDEMAAYTFTEQTLTGRGEATITRGVLATTPYFALLGMRPLLGRMLVDADQQAGAPPTIVLAHRFWSGRLGGDTSIVGTTLNLSGTLYEVAGVAAPQWEPWRADYYLPLGRTAAKMVGRTEHGSIRALGRLKPGVTLAAARNDLDTILSRLAQADPGPENEHRSYGIFLTDHTSGDLRNPLLLLTGAAVLILLIGCANVASLLLARNTSRASELALRKAIGAGSWRVARQLLTENLALAATGGLAGAGFAYWVLRALIALAPTNIPRLAETSLNLTVLLFACGVTLGAGLLASIAPLATAARVDLATTLREGQRLTGGGKQRQTLRNLLVIGEVALTFLLAFGSALLLRSLIAAQTASPGFQPAGVVTFALQLPGASYRSPEAISDFYTRLIDTTRTLPGVTAVSAISCPPGEGDCGDWFYSVAGRAPPARNEVPVALFNNAAAGYFQTIGVPLRQGREFTSTDTPASPKVAVINEALARTWWPNQSAVGQRIKVGGPYIEGPTIEIVGVVGDIKQEGLDATSYPEIFQPFTQQRPSGMTVVLRTTSAPDSLMPALRALVAQADSNLPLQNLGTLEKHLGAGLARRRFSALLLTLFAGLAMTLAAVGIYG